MKRLFPIIFFSLITVIFFKSFFFQFKLPIPSDTIVGLYHPFRDLYEKEYPRGIPFKNFLITDPVRQQFPWRELSISLEKKLELPLWNPYNFSGSPLLANFQSAPFYPLNLLFLILSFETAWSFLIVSQVILALAFMFLYLRNLKISLISAILGSIVFAFSGFSISWLEWGTVIHTAIWLPLILLSVDKIVSSIKHEVSGIKNKNLIIWELVFLFSLISSFFAGHLQIFFYVFIFSAVYFIIRWIQYGKNLKILTLFLIFYLSFFILTFVQWLPTLRFILESARGENQALWQKDGWFIPWQNLIQFIAPDFFGNPSTLNYWGIWNYAEFVGYVGIFPLVLAIFALFFRHDKKTLFFGAIFFTSLIFCLPTFFAKTPFLLNIPFLSTSQPTRLLFLVDFSLAVLSAFGLDHFLKDKKRIFYPLGFLTLTLIIIWLVVIFGKNNFIPAENLAVAKRNLFLPTILFAVSFILFSIGTVLKQKKLTLALSCIIVGIVIFDLFRFGFKFIPFTNKEYLFPDTKTTAFLQNKSNYYRIMSVDPRILAPNFSTTYRIQSLDGYDPLYLKRYGELIAASERGKPDISSPFGFNRIINPQKADSKIVDLLGVKYVLSLNELNLPKLQKVFQEGQTKIYENRDALPRAFFIEELKVAINKQEAINLIFSDKMNLARQAVVEGYDGQIQFTTGKVKINNYSENKIELSTENEGQGFLILTDVYYPLWHADVDGKEVKIYRTDYNFRGIIVPKGKHKIDFHISLI